jgi:hypothetical protein
MKPSAVTILLLFAGCGPSGQAQPDMTPPSDQEPAALAGMTAAHNAARAAVMPPASPSIPALTWSGVVAQAAQSWADQCMFKHNTMGYGQNLYATSGAATPQAVVNDWVSEVKDYDYTGNTCSGVCGHYTQVVWAKSLRLGCGVTNCTQNSPFGSGSWQNWVCDYDPPGNFVGEKPY